MDITEQKKHIEIFCCYSHKDQQLLSELKSHLKLWEYLQLITLWTDADISPGTNWQKEIFHHLSSADIILLLVSPDFLASEYCYSTEMTYAMKRYEREEVWVIPIILRSCAWEEAPFGEIQALPTNAKPVLGPGWYNSDEAFTDVARGIRKVVEVLSQPSPQRSTKGFLSTVENMYPNSSSNAFSSSTKEGVPPIESPLSRPSSRRISRRMITAGLLGLTIAGGGITLFALAREASSFSSHTMPPFQHSPTSLGTWLYTYRGHSFAHLATTNAVRGVAWSPNSKRIASAGWDMTVQVWDALDGRNAFIYKGHTNAVYTVAWSPDGKRIASAGYDQTVQVWDAVDGGNVYVYTGHLSVVRGVAWSPDGKRIASGDMKTVQVWDAADGGNVYTYRGHTEQVFMVAWSPDGKRIASASGDKTVQVWDAVDGGNVYTYRGHTKGLYAVAWSPDGKRIASASSDKTIQVWDAVDGGNVYTYRGHSDAVVDVGWSPDHTRIVSASDDRTVQVWNATNGGNTFTYLGHTNAVYTVAWSPDGSHIASAGEDSTVQVWGAG